MASLSIVVFGVTGDLSRGKVIPAIFDLYKRGKLPKEFHLVGYGRKPLSDTDFSSLVRTSIGKNDVRFISQCKYIQGELQYKEGYDRLRAAIAKRDRIIYFLSVHPELHITIINELGKEKLLDRKSQIMIEKPFGHDAISAKKLDRVLRKFIAEHQVYRIDHYLGKQSLIEFLRRRREDNVFEVALQNNLKGVALTQWEKKTIAGRGAFYDNAGALKDVGQNHLLQMAAAVIGDRDVACRNSERVQKARAAAIHSLRLRLPAARAQYVGYKNEDGVKKDSTTETFFSIGATSSLPNHKKTAIHFSAGKALPESKVEIQLFFKNPVKLKEGTVDTLCFSLNKKEKNEKTMEAYERILLAAIERDQSFFCSLEESIAGWKFDRNVRLFWKRHDVTLDNYSIGEKLGK